MTPISQPISSNYSARALNRNHDSQITASPNTLIPDLVNNSLSVLTPHTTVQRIFNSTSYSATSFNVGTPSQDTFITDYTANNQNSQQEPSFVRNTLLQNLSAMPHLTIHSSQSEPVIARPFDDSNPVNDNPSVSEAAVATPPILPKDQGCATNTIVSNLLNIPFIQ